MHCQWQNAALRSHLYADVIQPVVSPDFTGAADNRSPILAMINNATSSVLVEQLDCDIYWGEEESAFLSAIIEAARRGCKVRVLLDS